MSNVGEGRYEGSKRKRARPRKASTILAGWDKRRRRRMDVRIMMRLMAVSSEEALTAVGDLAG